MPAAHPSPFSTLETCFRLLTNGPAPLALDGRKLGHGAPARRIPLDELRTLLQHPAATENLRRAAIQELFSLATHDRGSWTIGLAGVLLPALRTSAGSAPPARHRLSNHLEADLLEQLHAAMQQPLVEAVDFAIAVLRHGDSNGGRSLPRFRPHRPVRASRCA